MSAADHTLPAFPESYGDPRNPGWIGGGMTLADYFASQAPITMEDAMLACGCTTHSIGMLARADRLHILAVLAEMRMDYASAMLATRLAGKPDDKGGD